MPKVRRIALSAGLVLAVGAAVAIPSSAAPARGKARSAERPSHGPSPALRSMLREIDARRVQSDIRTLVGFGTRHTLSSQTIPTAGSAPRATGSSTSSRATRPPRAGG